MVEPLGLGGSQTSVTLSLAVPADAAYMSTIRLFASVVGHHAECEEGLVDDLKLAVSEACTDPIEAGVEGQVHVTAELDEPGGFVIEIRTRAWAPGVGRLDLSEAPLEPIGVDRFEVVRALFPDAESVLNAEERIIRFSTTSYAGSPGA